MALTSYQAANAISVSLKSACPNSRTLIKANLPKCFFYNNGRDNKAARTIVNIPDRLIREKKSNEQR